MKLIWVTRVLGAVFCLISLLFGLNQSLTAPTTPYLGLAWHMGVVLGSGWQGWLLGIAIITCGETLRLLAGIRDAITRNGAELRTRP